MEQNSQKSKKERVTRVSKSGRIIKTPKAILTTSSDEHSPRARSSKNLTSVKSHLQRLREVAKNMNAKKNPGVQMMKIKQVPQQWKNHQKTCQQELQLLRSSLNQTRK